MFRQNYESKPIMIMNTFRKLWEQHIMWTRSFIISTAENLQDKDMVTKRLLQNPGDFANVLMMFYGKEKADKFEELLRQHLLISADLLNNAKAGNQKGADEARKKWYANADVIAEFLASINPYWSFKQWQMMLYDHLKETDNEAVQRLNKQYAMDINTYDKIEDMALMMADYMSRGILEQFKFN